MIRTHLKILVLSLAILPAMAYAEDKDEARLPDIEVEALRTNTVWLDTAASIYTVNAKKLVNTSKTNISDALKGIPGLQALERENYAQDMQISMRGFGARSTFGVRGIRIYVDGIPASMPDGQGQTSNIDLNSLEKIEVLGGPFSSLYGNSSGGTILATTREGEGKPSVSLGFNSARFAKQQTSLQMQGGSDTAWLPAYNINSSYFDTNGYRQYSDARKVLNNAKFTWNLNDGSTLNWIINQVRIRAADPGGLTREQWQQNPRQIAKNVRDYNMRKEIDQSQTGFTWDKPVNEHNSLYVMMYAGRRHVVQYQSIPAKVQAAPKHAGGVIDFTRYYYGTDVRWLNKNTLPHLTLIGGVAFDREKEDRQGYNNFNGTYLGVKGKLRRNENNTLWNLDPYMQFSWRFLPKWHLDGGLRYSDVHFKSQDHYLANGDDSGNLRYHKLLPSIALSWNFRDDAAAYIAYGKGFETPTFTEMAYRPDAQAGFNLNLKPSSNNTVEAGLKFDQQWGVFSATVFHTETHNDIVSAVSAGGRSTFRNADQTKRYGTELGWQKTLWQDLQVRASYSYVEARFDSDIPVLGKAVAVRKGNKIPGVAQNQLYFGLQWQPQQGWLGGDGYSLYG
ncbi:TonB-dependent receptor domain-containing protein [Snodgrassella alvi]|uniref:TonB-dependent receptor domain-containing protein n=1 Tax=Snodgrassella alvi TaxID=1196083 RepID=UPI001C556CDF|nr:TonB-dependent receptor [Snodgrassella alvi]